MKLADNLAKTIVNKIVSKIKLDEAILLCALRAERENRKSLATQLRDLTTEVK